MNHCNTFPALYKNINQQWTQFTNLTASRLKIFMMKNVTVLSSSVQILAGEEQNSTQVPPRHWIFEENNIITAWWFYAVIMLQVDLRWKGLFAKHTIQYSHHNCQVEGNDRQHALPCGCFECMWCCLSLRMACDKSQAHLKISMWWEQFCLLLRQCYIFGE